jgi:hypothetical protein
MKKIILAFFLTFFSKAHLFPQPIDSAYRIALQNLTEILKQPENTSFKKAVFITERAYDTTLSYSTFESNIKYLTALTGKWFKTNVNTGYKHKDSTDLYKSIAVFKLLNDTVRILIAEGEIARLLPYSYDFDDYMGERDWKKMFVTKLLATHKGNCHSLPYLYKILADESGVKNAWLSFAPNHIYIKNWCEQTGWYNTELTSGQFPVDAWIMASGYVSTDAIRSGIYMDTLSNILAVANCALDLAKGYERKFRVYTDSFIIKCCDLTLKYHPNNINAIIYKAETLRKMYFIYRKENLALATQIYPEMEKLYVLAMDLGYKEMPEKMYREWLMAVSKHKEKYSNKKVAATLIRK